MNIGDGKTRGWKSSGQKAEGGGQRAEGRGRDGWQKAEFGKMQIYKDKRN
jgi:hypothetical protein